MRVPSQLPRSRYLIAAVIAASAAAGCGSPASEQASIPQIDSTRDPVAPGPGSGSGEASWLNRPKDVKEAIKQSRAGVIGTVEAVVDAPPIQAAADEINPVQEATVRVRDRWFGEIPERVVIRWIGAPAGHLEGDPPYEAGQDYVLLLQERGDGPWWRPSSPDGRWQIVDGQVRGLIEGDLKEKTNGKDVAELKREVKEVKR